MTSSATRAPRHSAITQRLELARVEARPAANVDWRAHSPAGERIGDDGALRHAYDRRMTQSPYIGRKMAPGGRGRIILTIGFLVMVCVLGVIAFRHLDASTTQTWVTIAAVTIGGLYFAVRLIAGEFWSGITLAVELQRAKANDSSDYLAVTARIENKRTNSVLLYSATAVVRYLSSAQYVVLGDGFHRYPSAAACVDATNPPLPLGAHGVSANSLCDFLINPGDGIALVGVAAIPVSEPAVVDVVLIGRAYLGFVETQWVSSAIALPQ
jgi:hypothetical protein